jgi:hypothetical protein
VCEVGDRGAMSQTMQQQLRRLSHPLRGEVSCSRPPATRVKSASGRKYVLAGFREADLIGRS